MVEKNKSNCGSTPLGTNLGWANCSAPIMLFLSIVPPPMLFSASFCLQLRAAIPPGKPYLNCMALGSGPSPCFARGRGFIIACHDPWHAADAPRSPWSNMLLILVSRQVAQCMAPGRCTHHICWLNMKWDYTCPENDQIRGAIFFYTLWHPTFFLNYKINTGSLGKNWKIPNKQRIKKIKIYLKSHPCRHADNISFCLYFKTFYTCIEKAIV